MVEIPKGLTSYFKMRKGVKEKSSANVNEGVTPRYCRRREKLDTMPW